MAWMAARTLGPSVPRADQPAVARTRIRPGRRPDFPVQDQAEASRALVFRRAAKALDWQVPVLVGYPRAIGPPGQG
jgi:hypothetical protein